MNIKYTFKDIKNSYKSGRKISNVLFLQYPISMLLWVISNFTRITPNMITLIGFIFYMCSGYFFAANNLLIGAIFFELAYFGDQLDGKLARLKNRSTRFGAYLDNYTGMWGLLIVTIGLTIGQFLADRNAVWLMLSPLILFGVLLHFIESGLVARIIKDYKKVISSSKSEKDHLDKIRIFLVKHNLRDPLSGSEIKNTIFFLGPILHLLFGILMEVIIVVLSIIALKAAAWFVFYRRMLNKADKQT